MQRLGRLKGSVRVPFRPGTAKVLFDKTTCWWKAQYAGKRPPRGNRIAFARETSAPHREDEAPTYLQRARGDRDDIDRFPQFPGLASEESSEFWMG